jgi:hypothetical protein
LFHHYPWCYRVTIDQQYFLYYGLWQSSIYDLVCVLFIYIFILYFVEWFLLYIQIIEPCRYWWVISSAHVWHISTEYSEEYTYTHPVLSRGCVSRLTS